MDKSKTKMQDKAQSKAQSKRKRPCKSAEPCNVLKELTELKTLMKAVLQHSEKPTKNTKIILPLHTIFLPPTEMSIRTPDSKDQSDATFSNQSEEKKSTNQMSS